MELLATIFRQEKKLLFPYQIGNEIREDNLPFVFSFAKNIETYGFTASCDLIDVLLRLESIEDLIEWATKNEQMIKEEVGVREGMLPLFPNFPKEVLNSNESDLLYKTMLFLWHGTRLETEQARPELILNQELTPLGVALSETYFELFKNKITHKVSLNQDDFIYIKKLVQTFPNECLISLKEVKTMIVNRETFTYLMTLGTDNEIIWNELKTEIKNPTDVLRLQYAIETGNLFLNEDYHFKGVKRSLRREFLLMLNHFDSHLLKENFWKREKMWKEWARITHVGEFEKKFPKVVACFKQLREGKKPLSFHGKVNQLFEEKKHREVCELLMKRPTEMARALNRLMQLEFECFEMRRNDLTSHRFAKVVHEVPSNVLIQVLIFFSQREQTETQGTRFFCLMNGRVYGLDTKLDSIPTQWVENICRVCECALMERYEEQEILESVYLDENLKNYTLTMSKRYANTTLHPMAKGTHLPLDEETKTIRPFVYWKDPEGTTVDLDLHAKVYNEDFEVIEEVDYTALSSIHYGIIHSGDIREGGMGATEYLEIEIEKIKRTDAKYVGIFINSFSRVSFDCLTETFVGVMERDGMTGKTFEPSTVKQKANLTNSSECILAFIYDIDSHKLIWVDTAMKAIDKDEESSYLVRSSIQRKEMSLYDLFVLHIQARGGKLVQKEEDATMIFGGEYGVKPFEFDKIMTEYVR